MIETKTDFNALLKERIRVQKMVKKWSDKLGGLNDLILEYCPHDQTSTTKKSYEAGYDYYAEYHTTIKCLVCNKELDHKIEYGTSFG
jgi:hypothetical protein